MTVYKIDMERGEVSKDGLTLRFDFEKLPDTRVVVWYPDEGRGKIETLGGLNTSLEDASQIQPILDAFEVEAAKPPPAPPSGDDLPIRFYDADKIAFMVERLAKHSGLADENGKEKKDKTRNAP